MLHLPSHMLIGGDTPPGQALFLDNGSFIVPPGVTSLSAVAITRGGDASTVASGPGGSLRYVNNIPVVPGETLTIAVGSISYVRRGTTDLVRAATPGVSQVNVTGTGFNGGDGASKAAGASARGAGAGGYTSAGANAGTTNSDRGGQGSDPFGNRLTGGTAGGASNRHGGTYGGGPAAAYDAGSGITTPGEPGPGCVRLMWGPNRLYPNTNTGDV